MALNTEIPYDADLLVIAKAYEIKTRRDGDIQTAAMYDDLFISMLNEYNEVVADLISSMYKKLADVIPNDV